MLWSTPIFFSLQRAASLSRYELLGHLTRTARPLSGAPSWSCGPQRSRAIGSKLSTTTQGTGHCTQCSTAQRELQGQANHEGCSAVFTRVQVTWEIDLACLPNIPPQSRSELEPNQYLNQPDCQPSYTLASGIRHTASMIERIELANTRLHTSNLEPTSILLCLGQLQARLTD